MEETQRQRGKKHKQHEDRSRQCLLSHCSSPPLAEGPSRPFETLRGPQGLERPSLPQQTPTHGRLALSFESVFFGRLLSVSPRVVSSGSLLSVSPLGVSSQCLLWVPPLTVSSAPHPLRPGCLARSALGTFARSTVFSCSSRAALKRQPHSRRALSLNLSPGDRDRGCCCCSNEVLQLSSVQTASCLPLLRPPAALPAQLLQLLLHDCSSRERNRHRRSPDRHSHKETDTHTAETHLRQRNQRDTDAAETAETETDTQQRHSRGT